jgi:DNA-binding transcriptional MocR family regulator
MYNETIMATDGRKETERTSRYEQVAARVARMIGNGAFRPGERIPSVRQMSRQTKFSINTVMRAYIHLEEQGLVEARPRSGYYVRSRIPEPEGTPLNAEIGLDIGPKNISVRDIAFRIMGSLSDSSLVPLGRVEPNPDLLPIDRLNRMLSSASRRFRIQSVSYADICGDGRLRAQIARHSVNAGCSLSPEDVIITSGCREAVLLALHATCKPGDTVAVESPVYYGFLRSLEWMSLKTLEIPCSPSEGMNLEVLRYALRNNPVAAVLMISNFSNPLGSVMPDEKKAEFAELLAKHDMPLIEDDVYGDLSFDSVRPASMQAFDKKGLVLSCSSFSKTLAPGYRIGWIVPGRYRKQVEELKSVLNFATASPTQLAIAEFLTDGGYGRHLRLIRRAYAKQTAWMRDAVGRYFPAATRVTHPAGGFLLWVEMPDGVDSIRLYERALRKGIAVAPGPIFTSGDGFRNCLRLNAAYWTEQVEKAMEKLGEIAGSIC